MSNKVVHLGIIMDGNRRWAAEKGKSSMEGHIAGARKVREVVRWCSKRDIGYLTLYAFSTENWKRSKAEVAFLIKLIGKFLDENLKEFSKEGGQMIFIGDKSPFPESLKRRIDEAEIITRNNEKITVSILLNYGGRAEITAAVKKLVENNAKPEEITEELVAESLYTAGIPDPDLIIRTSGEQRLSNFLLWQSAYSELYFCRNHWPDFSEKDLDKALEEFSLRQRRLGK
ncbi:MAG: polyprenyl diphosphate synthase [Candidatus Pacebacteria bacterium]|nr:polyprenyl diphosphate synthase [Candidatus Paceibacterota bacterium]